MAPETHLVLGHITFFLFCFSIKQFVGSERKRLRLLANFATNVINNVYFSFKPSKLVTVIFLLASLKRK